MRKRIVSAILAATLLTGGGVLAAAPAQAATKLQWATMQPTQSLCANALSWKLREFSLKGVTVISTTSCRWTYKGWEAGIVYWG
jgi:hypothetical protein